VDHRADIYALGVVLYEMLTGVRPGKDLVAPSRKVAIDVRLDEMVLRALEHAPERRYQTAGEFRTVVETMAGMHEPDGADSKSGSGEGATPALQKIRKPSRKKKVKFLLWDGTPTKASLLAITLFCLLLGGLLVVTAEPACRLIYATWKGSTAFDAQEWMATQSLQLRILLGLGVGGILILLIALMALLLVRPFLRKGSTPPKRT